MWIATINFLHFAALLFVLSTVILVGVSLATPAPDPKQIEGLTRQRAPRAVAAPSPVAPGPRRGLPDVSTSFALAAVIGVLWIIFR